MQLYNTNSGSLSYQFVLENDGVGPAFITDIHISEKNGSSYSSLTDYLMQKITEADSIWVYNSDLYPGRLIPANKSVIIFGLYEESKTRELGLPPNTLKGAAKLRRLLTSDSLSIVLTYESIYGERWTLHSDSSMPVKH